MTDALGGIKDGSGNAVWKYWKKDFTKNKTPVMSVVGCCGCTGMVVSDVIELAGCMLDLVGALLPLFPSDFKPTPEPEPEPVPVPEPEPNVACFMCEHPLPEMWFSRTQRTKGANRKCRSCIRVYKSIPAVVDALYRNKCAYCRIIKEDAKWLTREHLLPQSKVANGDKKYQIRLACKQCNSARGNDMEWPAFQKLMQETPALKCKVHARPVGAGQTQQAHSDNAGRTIAQILQPTTVNNKPRVIMLLRRLRGLWQ